jgi:hypothetical protein
MEKMISNEGMKDRRVCFLFMASIMIPLGIRFWEAAF